jgi:hypothetical protein
MTTQMRLKVLTITKQLMVINLMRAKLIKNVAKDDIHGAVALP